MLALGLPDADPLDEGLTDADGLTLALGELATSLNAATTIP